MVSWEMYCMAQDGYKFFPMTNLDRLKNWYYMTILTMDRRQSL